MFLIKDINHTFEQPQELLLLIKIGICGGLVAILFSYSANPKRTPVILQSIFLGLAIIPCAIFSKLILKKQVHYDKKYLIASIFVLLVSVIVATIPMFMNNQDSAFNNILWSGMYLFGVIFLGLSNVLQEKYIMLTNTTFKNKIKMAFYTFLFSTLLLLILCWVDIVFGYENNTNDAFKSFINSFYVFGTDGTKMLLIQLFVLVMFVLVIVSIYLNAISTNYNMILTNVSNQVVALCFTIFPSLNSGIQYPLWVIIISLLLNIVSVVLWIKGESITQTSDNKTEMLELLVDKTIETDEKQIIDENTQLLCK